LRIVLLLFVLFISKAFDGGMDLAPKHTRNGQAASKLGARY
jgi:hypothetical protein